jgi:signal transduction histidine kinase
MRRGRPAGSTLTQRYLAATRSRLALGYAVLIALLLLIVVTATYLAARSQETSDIHAQLVSKVKQKMDASDLMGVLHQRPDIKDEEEAVRLFIVSRDGVLRDADAVVRRPPDPRAMTRVLRRGRPVFSRIGGPASELMVYTAPVIRGGQVRGAIQGVTSVAPYNAILHALLIVVLVVGGGGLLLAAGLGWLMADWGLQPTRRAITGQQAFAQNAAHELRAPLTVMRASAELALRLDDPQEMREALAATVRQVEHLDGVVADLRLLAQGDAARLVVETEPVALGAVVRDVYTESRAVAAERGIELRECVDAEAVVEGDALRLRQLLLILVDNALKYTGPQGQVDIVLQQIGQRAEVLVQDTGVGIGPEDLPHIFDRFYRGNPARTGEAGGAGLGLSIAREIAEAHGGRISAQSHPGKGAQFTVSLPIQAQPLP